MIEVQSLILSTNMSEITPAFVNIYETPIVEIFPINENVPVNFIPTYLAILRREDCSDDLDFGIYVSLCDKDNNLHYESEIAKRLFPKNHRFYISKGMFEFKLEKLGDYVIYFNIIAMDMVSSYRYDFVAMSKEAYIERASTNATKT